ncbi:MAG TPA: ribonuclease III [Elusimicrobiota bacterium]|nr:ribonuclease III [Elusimicrobiota bacterium]
METAESPEAFERRIRLHFKNKKWLEEALTHKSCAVENPGKSHNERLEFLGDSVLALAVAHYLFKRYEDDDEGRLSKLKSLLVSRATLVTWAKELDLGKYVKMSSGEEATGGRTRDSILANAFESILGAIFLDAGFPIAQRFIVRRLAKKKRIVETDYKSKLQEIIQKKYKIPPQYVLISESGPDHDKTFLMEVRLRRFVLGQGEGHSKKQAEQAAALMAVRQLKNKRIPKSELQ